jgi:hypothetical protein
MRSRGRHLLIAAALLALASDAWGQGMGLGFGIDDIRSKGGGSGSAAACVGGQTAIENFSSACNVILVSLGTP